MMVLDPKQLKDEGYILAVNIVFFLPLGLELVIHDSEGLDIVSLPTEEVDEERGAAVEWSSVTLGEAHQSGVILNLLQRVYSARYSEDAQRWELPPDFSDFFEEVEDEASPVES